MQLKIYSGKTSAEVLGQIKAELGNDAVILDTQEVDGQICMTAALERRKQQMGIPAARAAALYADLSAESIFSPNALAAQPVSSQAWHEEWGSIKQHLLALMKPALKMDELAPRQRLALEYLQRDGVSDESVLALYQALLNSEASSLLAPLKELIRVAPLSEEVWPEQLHFIAGPFGVGKTSVALRLALLLRNGESNNKVCLINADATRSNGRLLLRHYAELSDIPLKEASSALELAACIATAKREGFNRILVDLPALPSGQSLQDFLLDAGCNTKENTQAAVHLVLSPCYGQSQLDMLLKRYQSDFRGSIVWTKLDEAERFGEIVNVALQSKLPVSAFSSSPGLGHTLVPAEGALLWRLLFKRELPTNAS